MTMSRALPPMPRNIAALPVAQSGYPIPWFVAEQPQPDGTVLRDFRVASNERRAESVVAGRCYVCGQPLGLHKAFVMGPMGTINAVTSEGPMHTDCAEWSLKACPFLVNPEMRRRVGNYGGQVEALPGSAMHNTGLSLLWLTKGFDIEGPADTFLIVPGKPLKLTPWVGGRKASEEELIASFADAVRRLMDDGAQPMELAPLLAARATALGFSGKRRGAFLEQVVEAAAATLETAGSEGGSGEE